MGTRGEEDPLEGLQDPGMAGEDEEEEEEEVLTGVCAQTLVV